MSVFVYTVKNIGKFSYYVWGNFSLILRKHRFSYRNWKYFIDLRQIDRIFGLISELLGNISKRWEHFTNLLSCRKFFPWKAEIIPQKRKYVHFFWIFFHLNYEIYPFFLINWIYLRPNSRNYFQYYVGNISDYLYLWKNWRPICILSCPTIFVKILYSVQYTYILVNYLIYKYNHLLYFHK